MTTASNSKNSLPLETLRERRQWAADNAAERYDYGFQVVDGSGWSSVEPGTTWTKSVFLENDDDPNGDSMRAVLVVEFESIVSAKVIDVSATLHGKPVGNLI